MSTYADYTWVVEQNLIGGTNVSSSASGAAPFAPGRCYAAIGVSNGARCPRSCTSAPVARSRRKRHHRCRRTFPRGGRGSPWHSSLSRDDAAANRRVSFDLMVGNAVEADPQGYGEDDKVDSPLNHHPKILMRVQPKYPRRARDNRVSGAVRLFTLVQRDGSTVVLGVMTPLPHGCTEAAIAAVEKWTWQPRVFFGRESDALGLATVAFPPPE